MQGWLNGKHFPVPALRRNYLRIVEELGLSAEAPADLWDDAWVDLQPNLRTRRPPYLGLRPFGAGDRDLFFGRDAESLRLAEAVLERGGLGGGLVAVVGASGCGKSSLLAAGLVGTQTVSGLLSGWTVSQAAVDDLSGPDLVTLGTPVPQLVVVDQFEDVLAQTEDARAQVMATLADLVGSGAVVVIGLRADAFAAATQEPVLIESLSRPFLVTALEQSEARAAIVGPAAVAGVTVADDLGLMDECMFPAGPLRL